MTGSMRLRQMAEEGKGLPPAGHHRVRLPGEERPPQQREMGADQWLKKTI